MTGGLTVAMFTETYRPSLNGVATSLVAATDGLRALGHQVVVHTAGHGDEKGVAYYGGRPLPSYPDVSVAFGPAPSNGPRNPRAPDVIHVHSQALMGWRGARAARRHGSPLVATYHTRLEPLKGYAPWGTRTMALRAALRLERHLYDQASLILAPSASAADLLVGKRAAWASKIRVVPTGVDTRKFRPTSPAPDVRRSWGVPEGHQALLYVGRLAVEKNIDQLISAFDQLARQMPRAHLVIAGDGPARHRLNEVAAGATAARRIHFIGRVPGSLLPETYSAADAFASASETETQGLALLEAMASGLPCAVADAAGFRDLLADGTNGFLFTPRNPTAMVAAMRSALEAHRDIGRNARRRALACSADAYAARLDDVYREALESGEAPPERQTRKVFPHPPDDEVP